MSPQAGFVLINEVVPRLRSSIPHAVCLVGCEDLEELIQDGTAIAARMLHSAEAAGKRVSPGNIAYYAIRLLKSGRRSTGSSAVDVMEPATQLRGRTQLVSLEEHTPGEGIDHESFTLGEVLSDDREDAGVIAMRRLDWKAFWDNQPVRSRAILACTAAGEPLTRVANAHGVSRSSIQGNKTVLAREIKEFMGYDILQETMRQPQWQQDLAAVRGKATRRNIARY
jgi:hypothetical protein